MPSFHPTLHNETAADGQSSIYILITTKGQRAKVGTGIRIKPIHWNGKRREVRSSHREYDSLNKAIISLVNQLQAIYGEALSNGVQLSAKEIKSRHEQPVLSRQGFFAFCYEYLDRLDATGRINTMTMRKSIIRKFHTWMNVEDVDFAMITPVLIEKYISYLKTINGTTTVHANIKRLKEQFNRANKLGVYEGNPFRSISLPKGKPKRDKLTVEEVKAIEAITMTGMAELARRVWLFSFYCGGIRISDMCRLRHSDVKNGVLRYTMGKTGHIREIVLHEKAMALIPSNSKELKWLFPLLPESAFGVKPSPESNKVLTRLIASRTTMMNAALKDVAAAAGIPKRLTCHISRHTFADIARKKKLSTQVISELLGHSSIAITQQYFGSGFDDDTLDAAIRTVIE